MFIIKVILFLFFYFWSYASLAKYQVCSITINSSDEIEMFRKHLGSKDFNFIELVPLSEKSRPNNVHWFKEACQKAYRCDILVVSGHFGGLFFGENNNYILPVDIMENQSCSNSCAGLLSDVKEVFLFGCNTLAGKGRDHRTPEQYLQVLLDHHMARDMAETVVAARYLPFGLSFEEQMQFIFPSTTTIYGFTSLSPLGRQIRQPLSNYFVNINNRYGSYKNYFEQRKLGHKNPLIQQNIGSTITEVMGVSNNPEYQKMCDLYKNDVSKLEGISKIQELIKSGAGPKSYLAIKKFIAANRPFAGNSLSIFNEVKNNSSFKNSFYPLYSQISSRLPYMKIQYLNFLVFFNWVTSSFYKKELKKHTLKIVQSPTSEAYDFATALVHDEQISLQDLNLSAQDFSPDFYKNIWSALILETLNVKDYLAHRRLMNTCLSKAHTDPVICYQVLKSLGHLKVNDSLIIDKMISFLDIPHSGLVYYSIYGLAYTGIQNRSMHRSIARHINNSDKWIKLQAIRAVGLLKSKDEQVSNILLQLVRVSKDEEIIYEGLKSLYYMQPPVEAVRQVIINRKLHKHSNTDIRNISLSF